MQGPRGQVVDLDALQPAEAPAQAQNAPGLCSVEVLPPAVVLGRISKRGRYLPPWHVQREVKLGDVTYRPSAIVATELAAANILRHFEKMARGGNGEVLEDDFPT